MVSPASDWVRHFRLLWNRWIQFNETWQEARSQRPLPNFCFFVFLGQSETDIFSPPSLKPLNRIQGNLTGSKISCPPPSLYSSGWTEKQDGRPSLWLAETFSTSSLKLLYSMKFDRKQDLYILYPVSVLGLIRNLRWPPWPLICWYVFYAPP